MEPGGDKLRIMFNQVIQIPNMTSWGQGRQIWDPVYQVDQMCSAGARWRQIRKPVCPSWQYVTSCGHGGQIWDPVWPCSPNVIYWGEGDKFGIVFDKFNQIWPAGDRGNKFKIKLIWLNQLNMTSKVQRDNIRILHLCTSAIAVKSITDHYLTCLVVDGHRNIQFLL
jgi:hypothetical protein